MIGRLSGTVGEIGDDWIVLDVGGVGYEVHCSARTLARLPRASEPATLFVETRIRDELIRLYGFASVEERHWFRALQGVQGVGAKVALAVLGALTPDELATAIAADDTAAISRAHGVGKRVAQRIAAELKELAGDVSAIAPVGPEGSPEATSGARADAVSALVNLGYGRSEAAVAVAAAQRSAGDTASAEMLIRLGLKELVR